MNSTRRAQGPRPSRARRTKAAADTRRRTSAKRVRRRALAELFGTGPLGQCVRRRRRRPRMLRPSASGMGAALPLGAFVFRPSAVRLALLFFCISPPGKFIGPPGGIKTPATHFVAHKLNSLRPVCVLSCFPAAPAVRCSGGWMKNRQRIQPAAARAASAGKVSQRGFSVNKVPEKCENSCEMREKT